MVSFPLVIAAILAVVGLILLIGGIGLLFWTLWKGWVLEPSRRAAQASSVPDGRSEATPQ